MKKLTNEEYIKRLQNKHGNEYTLLTPYRTMKEEIIVKHKGCGEILSTTPDKLLRGGCIKCGYKKMKKAQRKTNEQFLEEVSTSYNGMYQLVDTYVNNTTKLKFYHEECNCYFYATPRDFLQGKAGCPACKNKRISKSVTKTHEYFLELLGDSLGEEYQILSKYKNAKTKMKVKHNVCGLEFFSTPPHILEGKRCPECWKNKLSFERRKTHDKFCRDLGATWFDDYELLNEYESQRIKVKVKHKHCGNVFDVFPDSILAGSGCPRCKESRGEKKVFSLLKEKGYNFIPQLKFSDCIYKSKLPFDFGILDKENNVILLIEYQGIQHYKPVSVFGGLESFLDQQKRDSVKREYAKAKGIPLIEIKYDENIEERIKELDKLIPR